MTIGSLWDAENEIQYCCGVVEPMILQKPLHELRSLSARKTSLHSFIGLQKHVFLPMQGADMHQFVLHEILHMMRIECHPEHCRGLSVHSPSWTYAASARLV